ncbi:hypothetical protein K7I13_07180 [Brucepastera parasyntrophica]|uniref:hypothetical protein n=1 Tax=Brucepastera parasyntrophica TaxID=2880008 RepID=UPI00210E8272|nr:hypothetical protein [Brucepastera parasyntrophica]ULQ61027.1 hypothetical protein K7I13_07180 [Brucepastera parasyntrophica]
MNDKMEIPVDIPLDDNGFIGRECLECERYFKLKPGTGLPTKHCHCPYCDYEGDGNTFWTKAQIEYAQSVALNQVINKYLQPSFDKLNKTFKDLERKSRNSLIKFKFKVSNEKLELPIKYYNEKELETYIVCDSCGLEFAVYGVFARCPDCAELNAFLIYDKSLDITEKKLFIFLKPEIPNDIRMDSYKFILFDCISAFDGLGKELRKKVQNIFPERPKNIFQNLNALDDCTGNIISNSHSNYQFIFKMFQVRHIYEHNMGVIDEDFIKKLDGYSDKLGMRYNLSEDEIKIFIQGMRELGLIIKKYLKP